MSMAMTKRTRPPSWRYRGIINQVTTERDLLNRDRTVVVFGDDLVEISTGKSPERARTDPTRHAIVLDDAIVKRVRDKLTEGAVMGFSAVPTSHVGLQYVSHVSFRAKQDVARETTPLEVGVSRETSSGVSHETRAVVSPDTSEAIPPKESPIAPAGPAKRLRAKRKAKVSHETRAAAPAAVAVPVLPTEQAAPEREEASAPRAMAPVVAEPVSAPDPAHLTGQTNPPLGSPSPKGAKASDLTSQIRCHELEARQAAKEHQEDILAGHTRNEGMSYGVALKAYRLVLDFAADAEAGYEFINASRVKPGRKGTNQHWQLVATLYASPEGELDEKIKWTVTAISKVTLECKRRDLDMDGFRDTLREEGGFTGFYKKHCKATRESSKPPSPKAINEDMAAIQERVEAGEGYLRVQDTPLLKAYFNDISPGLAIMLVNIGEGGDIMPLGVSILPRETKQQSWIVQTFPEAAAAMKKEKPG